MAQCSSGGNPTETYPKSNAAARKALELDASLAHPHAVLGSNEMEHDWDFAGGESEYKKSFELDPKDAWAQLWYTFDVGMIGRDHEALAEVNRAHQLDPLLPNFGAELGGVQVILRHYDEAILVCRKLANVRPKRSNPYYFATYT